MSSEPERPIEKLLRASAKQTREQAGDGWPLHPATRRLLQQEVAHRFGRKPASGRASLSWLFGAGWLRPLVSFGVVLAIGVTLWLTLAGPGARRRPELLAKNEPVQSEFKAGRASSSAPVAELPPELSKAENQQGLVGGLTKDLPRKNGISSAPTAEERALTKQSPVAQPSPLAAAPAAGPPGNEAVAQAPALALDAATARSLASSVGPQATAMSQRYGLRQEAQPTAAPVSSTAISTVVSAAAESAGAIGRAQNQLAIPLSATATAEQQLYEMKPATVDASSSSDVIQYGTFTASQQAIGKARRVQLVTDKERKASGAAAPQVGPPTNQILVSFRVEQAGGQLRIIDSDNSVYSGPIQAANTNMAPAGSTLVGAQGPLARTALVRDMNANTRPSLQYLFRVVGTNRNSNQQVIFSGTLNTDTNLPGIVSGKDAPVFRVNRISDNLKSDVQPTTQNLRLSGTVLIGNEQSLRLEAVPALPQQPQSR